MYIRPSTPSDPADAWAANLGSQVNNNRTVAGSGVVVRHGNNGASVYLADTIQPTALNCAVAYNFSSSYQPGDIVYVDPTKTYYDQNSSLVPIITGSSASGLPAIGCGLYVCVYPVPPLGYDSTMLTDYVSPAYESASQSITDEMADTFRWYSYNCYWPIYPTIPTSSLVTASVSDYTITANLNFWLPLSPMFVSQTCQADGSFQNTYVNGVISGSAFNLAQLPYTG